MKVGEIAFGASGVLKKSFPRGYKTGINNLINPGEKKSEYGMTLELLCKSQKPSTEELFPSVNVWNIMKIFYSINIKCINTFIVY